MQWYWEIDGDPITDDYGIEEITAPQLWDIWVDDLYKSADWVAGPDIVKIHWSVGGNGIAERAPFQGFGEDLLTFFTWPEDEQTGARLQWSRLPVIDKLWRVDLPPHATTKGGFIQETTGWKPSPLQPSLNLRQLAAMAGMPYPPSP